MVKKTQIHTNTVSCEIRKNPLSKSIKLHVYPTGRVLVTIPRYMSIKSAEQFLKEKEDWIRERLAFYKMRRKTVPQTSRKEYIRYKKQAKMFLLRRIPELNQLYGFSYGRISVRDQRTRWGSCSSKRNLNFHYKILFLPPELADYLIVHELCHLKELNHSQKFWGHVAQTIPKYKETRKLLRQHPL